MHWQLFETQYILRYIGFVYSNREGPPFTAIVGKAKEICAGASQYLDVSNNHFLWLRMSRLCEYWRFECQVSSKCCV